MSMKFKVATIALICCIQVNAAESLGAKAGYQPSSDVLQIEQSGVNSRRHSFLNVYCLDFPGEGPLNVQTQMFSGGAVNFARVEYPEMAMANIVVSTMPAGRKADEEIERLLTLEKNAESAYKANYHIQTIETGFGKAIGLRINDVAPAGRSGPFPLSRPIYSPAKKPIESMSVHREFVRGSNRFEVAVYQLAPKDANVQTEEKMLKYLTDLADQIVSSMHTCKAGS